MVIYSRFYSVDLIVYKVYLIVSKLPMIPFIKVMQAQKVTN